MDTLIKQKWGQIPHDKRRELCVKVFAEGKHVTDAAVEVLGQDGYAWVLAARSSDRAIQILFEESFGRERKPMKKRPNSLEIKAKYVQDMAGVLFPKVLKVVEDLDLEQGDDKKRKRDMDVLLDLHRDMTRLLPREAATQTQHVPFDADLQEMSMEQLEAIAFDDDQYIEQAKEKMERARQAREMLSGARDATFELMEGEEGGSETETRDPGDSVVRGDGADEGTPAEHPGDPEEHQGQPGEGTEDLRGLPGGGPGGETAPDPETGVEESDTPHASPVDRSEDPEPGVPGVRPAIPQGDTPVRVHIGGEGPGDDLRGETGPGVQ